MQAHPSCLDPYIMQKVPDKGVLLVIHPGLQLQAGVFAKGRDNQAEHEGNAHEDSWQHNLQSQWKTDSCLKRGVYRLKTNNALNYS